MSESTSTTNASAASSPTPGTKPLRKKGPFRTGAVVPTFIIIALIWGYFFFFFDLHAKHALEYVGTHANGAEVDIATVRTSFWNASLEISGIQVTDGSAPMKNKIQIGEMRWQMLWDALLRGKVAIEDASILNIAIGAPRKSKGYVLPPDPPATKSVLQKVRDEALAKAQDQFSQNVLGDAANILAGTNPADQLKAIEGSLKSEARVKELQDELTKKEAEWKDRIAKLPAQKEIDDLQKRIKTVKLDHFNNPAEIQQSLQAIQSIYNDTNSKIASVQDTAKTLNTDVNTYKNTLTDLDKMVKEDIKGLEGRLKLPNLDVKNLSRQVFGPLFLSKVKNAEFYYAKAKEYMPEKKPVDHKNDPPKPHEREKGRNYAFGKPHAYPLFWLKHAAISSKTTAGADYSGDLKGTLKDVTNDQPTLGVPMIAEFNGDFPKQELHGVNGKITINHVTEDSDDKAEIHIASLPINGQMLVNSPDVQLGFDKAVSQSSFIAEMRDKEINITANNVFSRAKAGDIPTDPNAQLASTPLAQNPQAGVTDLSEIKSANDLFGDASKMAARKSSGFLAAQAKSPALNDILNGALSDIPKVTLNASVHGPWTALDFDINSSLGADLAAAFDKQIKAKIDEAKAKVQALVNSKINEQKAKLEAEFNKQKSQIDSILKDKQAELDKYKGQLDQAKNNAVKGQTNQLQDAAKKGLDDLKNKFHF